MPEPDICSAQGLGRRAETSAAISSVMARYYQGVEEARVDLLDEAFHAEWLMRDTDTPGATLLGVEGKGAFIERVTRHGPYPGYAEGRVIASVAVAHDQLAFVRVTKEVSQSATDFFLFKLDGQWVLMDKVWMNPREERLTPRGASTLALIGDLVDRYHEALAMWDRDTLAELLHVQWDLKIIGPESGLQRLGKEEFLFGPDTGKEALRLDYSRLLSVETCQDGMAVVRVDLPSRSETRFLVILRVGENWKIVAERQSRSEPR